MRDNPYTTTFGKEPGQSIPRVLQISTVLDAFCAGSPNQQVFMITGPRGSGKTVFMSDVSKRLAADESWEVVGLNPERDLLVALASKLSSRNQLAALFKSAKINLSFFGFGLEVSGSVPITDIEVALERMLASMKAHGKRLLVTIDEVTNTQTVREFAAAYQLLLREDLPVFLLMTGLYDNIRELQNQKSLTFLYRAPKIELKPLNLGAIARNYQRTLQVESEEALRMAQLTRGYSFAFQVLGSLAWEHGGMSDSVFDEYRQYLDDFVYDKMWSELSEGDRLLAWGIARTPTGKVAEVRELLDMETNRFNPYRRRLIQKGIVNGDRRGYVSFTLPCFEDYVLEHYGEQI